MNNRLVVLIGSKPRSLDISVPFINFLLEELISMPYDIYICCEKEEEDEFKVLKNIKNISYYEDCLKNYNSQKIELWKKLMGRNFHQWTKLFFAKEACVKSKVPYTFGLKLRTDFVINSEGLKKKGIDLKSFKIDAKQKFLNCAIEQMGLAIGDKFMYASYPKFIKWANLAADCESLRKKMSHYVPLKWKDSYKSVQYSFYRYKFPKKFINNCGRKDFYDLLQGGIEELRSVYNHELSPEESFSFGELCFGASDLVADLQFHEVTGPKYKLVGFPTPMPLIFSGRRRENSFFMKNNMQKIKEFKHFFKI